MERLHQDQIESTITQSSSLLEIQEEVNTLVKRTQIDKSVDELMDQYKGKEHELVDVLRRYQLDMGGKRAEVEDLAARTNPGKGVNELMYQYRGREDELISNLKRLQQDQEHSTINPSSSLLEIRAEVESFVERTNPGKSVDDLMYEYRGRELELVSYLQRYELHKGGNLEGKLAEVTSLIEKTNPGKSVGELMYQYYY